MNDDDEKNPELACCKVFSEKSSLCISLFFGRDRSLSLSLSWRDRVQCVLLTPDENQLAWLYIMVNTVALVRIHQSDPAAATAPGSQNTHADRYGHSTCVSRLFTEMVDGISQAAATTNNFRSQNIH